MGFSDCGRLGIWALGLSSITRGLVSLNIHVGTGSGLVISSWLRSVNYIFCGTILYNTVKHFPRPR